jgi:hypothetical protein
VAFCNIECNVLSSKQAVPPPREYCVVILLISPIHIIFLFSVIAHLLWSCVSDQLLELSIFLFILLFNIKYKYLISNVSYLDIGQLGPIALPLIQVSTQRVSSCEGVTHSE